MSRTGTLVSSSRYMPDAAKYNFLIAFNFPGGLISILIPSGLIHNYISLTIHAFLWHAILLFIGFYLFLSKRAGFDKTEFKSSLKYFYICFILAHFIIPPSSFSSQ